MLTAINTKYIIFGLSLFLVYTPFVSYDFFPIHLFNIMSMTAYYFLTNYSSSKSESRFNDFYLKLTVFFYSLLFVFAFNILSIIYRKNYFVFSEVDAIKYHYQAIKMNQRPILDAITHFLNYSSLEDLGAVLILSSLYRIAETNLILNIFYVIVGTVTALGLFSIGKRLMSKKYAFICAITYSLSSFVLWFNASGLKESFMIMLIVLFFDQYYKYLVKPNFHRLVAAGGYVGLLILFRPAILFFCLSAVLISHFLMKKVSIASVSLILLLIVVLGSSVPYVEKISDRYIYGDTIQMIERKQASGAVKGSVTFTYAVNILAQAVGPLPTLIPNIKTVLSFFSVGLIYRVFISLTFWFGVYYSFKLKQTTVYPLIIFVLIEMASLIFILEGLELRKSLPHFPAIYLVSFWFIDFYGSTENITIKSKIKIKKAINISILFFSILIVYWNTR